MKKLFTNLGMVLMVCALALFPTFAAGQTNLSQIGHDFYAQTFAQWRIVVDQGAAASGAGTLTFFTAEVALPDGRRFIPFSVNNRITIQDGANTETVTPTSVSGCNIGAIADSCQVTATFSFAHPKGVFATSGSFGVDEAANVANAFGGGVVVIDSSYGGTTTGTGGITTAPFLITGIYPKVIIRDGRSGSVSYWRPAPGLTAITLPTALTKAGGAAATLTTSTTGGAIATGQTPRFCVTAVDFFGGETACSDDSNANAALVDGAGSTNSYTITAAGVPVGTGIVGYRVYISATGGTTQTETLAAAAQLSGTVAPLCPLAACMAPATAILITALPATTAAGPPPGTAGVATALASAHTTVVPVQTGKMPPMMPFVDTAAPGFFPVTVTSATTLVVGFDVMGELHYPANFFTGVGSSYRVCGGGVVTPSAATVIGVWTLRVGPRQNSAGTSTAQIVVPWSFVASTLFTGALNAFDFCTDLTVTTNGVSGIMEGHGSVFCAVPTAGTAAGVTGCETAFNAASGAIDLTQEGVIDLTYVQSAASWTLPQLRYFSITRL